MLGGQAENSHAELSIDLASDYTSVYRNSYSQSTCELPLDHGQFSLSLLILLSLSSSTLSLSLGQKKVSV